MVAVVLSTLTLIEEPTVPSVVWLVLAARGTYMNISYWLPLFMGRSRRSAHATNGVCAFRFSRNFLS